MSDVGEVWLVTKPSAGGFIMRAFVHREDAKIYCRLLNDLRDGKYYIVGRKLYGSLEEF